MLIVGSKKIMEGISLMNVNYTIILSIPYNIPNLL